MVGSSWCQWLSVPQLPCCGASDPFQQACRSCSSCSQAWKRWVWQQKELLPSATIWNSCKHSTNWPIQPFTGTKNYQDLKRWFFVKYVAEKIWVGYAMIHRAVRPAFWLNWIGMASDADTLSSLPSRRIARPSSHHYRKLGHAWAASQPNTQHEPSPSSCKNGCEYRCCSQECVLQHKIIPQQGYHTKQYKMKSDQKNVWTFPDQHWMDKRWVKHPSCNHDSIRKLIKMNRLVLLSTIHQLWNLSNQANFT